MVYFTSDLHLCGEGTRKMQARPFNSVEHMNKSLIANINSKCKPDDMLYI